MILDTFQNFTDFELLDSGNGYRLERWGGVVLQRPDPQVIWEKSLPNEAWAKAWAVFRSGRDDEKGKWEIEKPVPNPWIIEFKGPADRSARYNVDTKFLLKLSPFKHTGIFAEQAAQWEWMLEQVQNEAPASHPALKILNLFAYTGGATMVLAKTGCQVTHVDASKPAITWANENHKLNNLPGESVRWMLDDVVKFVQRELKRGNRYDGIIMDPPAFGHSPSGKTWKFNRDLPRLLADCVKLLSPNAKFLVINGYATNSSALALHNVLEDAVRTRDGSTEFGELCLKQNSGRMLSTGIFARWKSA